MLILGGWSLTADGFRRDKMCLSLVVSSFRKKQELFFVFISLVNCSACPVHGGPRYDSLGVEDSDLEYHLFNSRKLRLDTLR